MANAGVGCDGQPIQAGGLCLPNEADGLKSGNVTLYSSGEAVWINLDPLAL